MYMREIGVGVGVIFEQVSFMYLQVYDVVVIDQIVLNGLDEVGMWLWMFIGGFGFYQFFGLEIDIEMILVWVVDVIGLVQVGVELLWGVWCYFLGGEYVVQFVIKGLGIGFGVEVVVFLVLVGLCFGQVVEYLMVVDF